MVEFETRSNGLIRRWFLLELKYYRNHEEAITRGWWRTWFIGHKLGGKA
jgi:hypothetical protein